MYILCTHKHTGEIMKVRQYTKRFGTNIRGASSLEKLKSFDEEYNCVLRKT